MCRLTLRLSLTKLSQRAVVLLGSTLWKVSYALTLIPITDGRLNMGTWQILIRFALQGIWLCEHRDHANPRKIVITLNGV
ncbi:hypothetical protein PR202_gb06465 [Eleusine coracana subsp. coracana]|uniref:Uncharacterized protein n=1 Tax=Eleusine coracana subsp. coracana TaxID=191504 RepID=A0AAV5E8Y1_ELECO|nr:hypothetical protein PR202_gb06465 [Eleusine coracana subsp. coracana]